MLLLTIGIDDGPGAWAVWARREGDPRSMEFRLCLAKGRDGADRRRAEFLAWFRHLGLEAMAWRYEDGVPEDSEVRSSGVGIGTRGNRR